MTAARHPLDAEDRLTADELRDAWPLLSVEDRALSLGMAPRADAEDVFLALAASEQADILLELPLEERRSWMRLLAPDDAADLVQAAPAGERDALLAMLDEQTRREVVALMAYAEDRAGGLMNPRYARLRPDMTIDEAISYVRRQARETVESIYYLYVLDEEQRLLGVISLRELFAGDPSKRVRDVMRTDLVSVTEEQDQESVSRLFDQYKYVALPVLDAPGRMKGIVTADDIVDVVREEATEDIQKLGGMQSFEQPYMQIAFWALIRKRGGWLSALFLGELLTASAMGYFQNEIARAVVLTLFIPLIISSGGNSGSQATTLVIRAMALGEVGLRDWWRVIRRELGAGLALGSLLGALGFVRVVAWERALHTYGPHYLWLAFTVFFSLIGVVTFGTVAGSLLPFLLRRLRLDPASASAPFVATLVDVTGLVIYFTVANVMLRGRLL